MTPERWQQVKRVFQGALEHPADQGQYLDRECAGDADLRIQVEALLESHARPGDFLENPIFSEVEQPEGTRIGPYRIIRKIARGGMGAVYLAERCDGQYEKTVAIKLVTPGVDMASILARFRIERQILANLEHPNIARLLDGGLTDDGRPYIVMEHIDGIPIDEYCDQHSLSMKDRLNLFEIVCAAVHYAHQKQVIHRDIKPSNVLVTEAGVPKLLDFGIGKILGSDVPTSVTQLTAVQPMTPAFASPEQMNGDLVTASSDIYSLGVLLHILLTGRHPFQPGKEPGPLRRIEGDLEDIVSMCLRKEPKQRYPAAAAIAEDIRRHLDTWPITARRHTAAYRATRFVQRNKFSLKITAYTLVACLVVAAGLFSVRTNKTSSGPRLRSIAVLPFNNLASDSANEYLELGMAEALTAQLSNFKQVTVTPTSAVREYAGAKRDPLAAGRALKVDSVLASTIQKSGDQIRVTAQLIDVQNGTPLWADSFDEKLTNIFALQDSISTRISAALQLEITAAHRERVYRRYTDNVAAYDSYLQGRSQLLKNDRQQALAAVQSFENALKLDGNYALAYAGLASASALMRLRFAPTLQEIKTWEAKAHQYAETALKLDPGLAEAHEARADVYSQTEFDWERTLEESRLALDLNSNRDMPHYYRGRALYHLGLFDLADEESLLGLKVSPENRIARLRVQGVTALFAGRFTDAVALLEESQSLKDGTVGWQLAMAYYYRGDRPRGERMLDEMRGGIAEQRAKATLASFLAARGENAKAKELLREVIGYGEKDHHVAYSIGATYAQLGSASDAVLWLTRAKESGFPCYPWFKQDPLIQPLHDDAAFEALLSALEKDWARSRARHSRS